MQLRFPFFSAADPAEPSPAAERAEHGSGSAAESAEDADKAPLIHFVRMRRARRYVMRVRPDGDLRVTITLGPTEPATVQFLDVAPLRREDSLAPGPVCR